MRRFAGVPGLRVAHAVSRGYESVERTDLTARQVYEGERRNGRPGEAGRKRDLGRQLILRFLTGAPRLAEDLRADVMSGDITERTYERARADLADEGLIERFQQGGRHWWRIAVPDSPPR